MVDKAGKGAPSDRQAVLPDGPLRRLASTSGLFAAYPLGHARPLGCARSPGITGLGARASGRHAGRALRLSGPRPLPRIDDLAQAEIRVHRAYGLFMKNSMASDALTLSPTVQPVAESTVRPIIAREFGQVTR